MIRALLSLFRKPRPKRFASILGVKVLAIELDATTAKGGRYGL